MALSVAKRRRLSEAGESTGVSEEPEDVLRAVLDRLGCPLGPSFLSTRQGPGKTTLSYLDSSTAVRLANFVFGNNNWSSQILTLERKATYQGDKWTAQVTCTSRVTVDWGGSGRTTFHEDVGFGGGKPFKTEGEAIELGVKEARTDSLKRTLRLFGEALGNCVYDKRYLEWLKREGSRFKSNGFLPSWGEADLLLRLPPSKGCTVAPTVKVQPQMVFTKVDEEDYFDDDDNGSELFV
jgi:DNA recombination protein Rad52